MLHIHRIAVVFLLCGAAFAQPPVILISIDTLRADRLSCNGYRGAQTPNLDAFAQHGTLFRAVDAQVPLTLPSHTSLFTSTYPFENQIEENAERVPAGAVTLASVLRSNRYKTAAFIGSVFLEAEMGLDQGFDYYDSPFHFEAFSPMSGSVFFGGDARMSAGIRDRRDGALVIGSARRWLAANRNQPAFAFIHLFDLHKPYRNGSYDAGVQYVDRLLGGLRDNLVKDGWWDRAIVVLLSDHGESLDEHGESSHGYFIYESTLWVPLLIHFPADIAGFPVEVKQPGGLIDVAPTILEALHLPAPASFEGKSLMGATRPVYSESLHAHDAFGWSPLRSLRVGPYKYVEAPKPELYRLDQDPHERKNLIAGEPGKAREMKAALAGLLAAHAPKRSAGPGEVSPQTRALLGSLGYLAGGPKTASLAAGPDPKDRLGEFQAYELSQVQLFQGQRDRAMATLRRLLLRDPKNMLARRDLGSCLIEDHNWAEARTQFQQVLAAAPDDYVSLYELGVAQEHLGELSLALRNLNAACAIAPGAVQCRTERDAVLSRIQQIKKNPVQ